MNLKVPSYKVSTATKEIYLRLEPSASSHLRQGVDPNNVAVHYTFAVTGSDGTRVDKQLISPWLETNSWMEQITGSIVRTEVAINTPIVHQDLIKENGMTASLKSIDSADFVIMEKQDFDKYITFR